MTDPTHLLVATLEPTPGQQRAAFAVAGGLLLFFVAIFPFAGVKLPTVNAVVPMVSMIMALGDCISAVLLFGQFAVLRMRALLVLAGGYLFTGLVVIPYALTFPGALSETGLLGANVQTAAWLFVFWHTGLPISVIGYALLRDTGGEVRLVRASVPRSIVLAAGIALALALALTWIVLRHVELLPRVAADAMRLTPDRITVGTAIAVSAAAVVLLAAKRRSVLDLWLLVVAFAWLLDSILTYLTETRYTGAWYANRVIRIVSANVVLFVLVAESMRLYARIAASLMAQRRERDRRTMTMRAMAAAIEHEMRQPLGAIAANASAAGLWLGRPVPNVAAASEAIGTIGSDVERANEVIRSVRRLCTSRDRQFEPLDANKLVRETLSFAHGELEPLGIRVELELARELRPVHGDRRQLQEVILNLVSNAAEAMRAVHGREARLRIASAALDGSRLEIKVIDSGTGIDPAATKQIFDPFFTTKADGTGMGLAICRSIVEGHGGTLSAEPGTPNGAVFRVVLPCA